MKKDEVIPLHISVLIVGFFQQKLTDAEQLYLDNWIGNSIVNQRAFESFLEMIQRPVRPIEEMDNSDDFLYIADLFMKKIKQTITPKEQLILDQWKQSTSIDPKLLKSLEESSSIESLFERLKMHFHHLNTN